MKNVPFSFLISLLLYLTVSSARALGNDVSKRVTAGSLQQVTSFGDNASGTLMYIYVPNNLATNPGIIVAIHYCTGTAQAYYTGSPYAQLAEEYGFIVIYPESPYSGTCWDVSSQSALTHNGGGDSNSIANMVTWTISQYKADTSKVFVTGSSSGAMMTNVMAATYPELFAAATVYSGVSAGCFYSSSNQVDGWNSSCAQGNVISTPAVWAGVAEAMYSGYSGSRPRMQIYHGSTDTILYPQNYYETCKQWAGVFGYSYDSPESTLANTPDTNYQTTNWGPKLQGIYATGVGHTVPIHGTQDMEWFGFSSSSSSSTTTASATKTSTTTKSSTSSTATSTGVAAHWGQCGGSGWTGPTVCATGYTCTYANAWYSQCL
ncbi:Putative Acetylxylan esterase A [Penicillium brasilianum]|uniref:Carboxylic ester hydrolase n=1 Tax=Penicillium brasilianum TaxID=104259 RepID=A0A0F7TZQ8_PENBI|nr:Putative Acetylxylan esterase A [Penicillium brasilianum]